MKVQTCPGNSWERQRGQGLDLHPPPGGSVSSGRTDIGAP